MKTALALIALALATPTLADPVYELRTYYANEGKIDALHARFRDHTVEIFARHGMQSVAYWAPNDTADTIIYILEHASAEAVEGNWAAFLADPEWQEVYAASIADGNLVKKIDAVFMSKTDYSP